MLKSSESLDSRISSAGGGTINRMNSGASSEAAAGAPPRDSLSGSGAAAAAPGGLLRENSGAGLAASQGRPPLPSQPRTSRLSLTSAPGGLDGSPMQGGAAGAAAAAGMRGLSLSEGGQREDLAPGRSSGDGSRAGGSAYGGVKQQGQGAKGSIRGSARGSMDSQGSPVSRGSGAGGGPASVRSSFAQEGPVGEDVDAYGRPSLALFETAHRNADWQKGEEGLGAGL